MNWDAIGAVGEVGGAVAVVVTLIYLAGQLRQNTNALRSASYEHWNEISSSWADFFARYAVEISEIEQLTSMDQLTEPQRKIHGALALRSLNQAHTSYLQHRAGTLDDDVFEARMRAFQGWLGFHHFNRDAWRTGARVQLTPDFVEFVESRVSDLTPKSTR
jgi:hypothetical protein